jgi:hypothetical protein
LWGIDIALDTRVDPAQLKFFLDILASTHVPDGGFDVFERGDNVILCTAKPSWLRRYSDDARTNLAYFVKEIVEGKGGRVPLILAGDLHHYARYQNEAGQHVVTAGGGGAYVMGNASLAAAIRRPRESTASRRE